MSIDLSRETLVPFGKLARSLPRRRRDRPVATSTIHRWHRVGLKGIRLEAVRVGGAWCTTHEAFQRFVARLTAASDATPSAAYSASAQVKKTKSQADRDVW